MKKTIAAALSIVAILSLASCGGNSKKARAHSDAEEASAQAQADSIAKVKEQTAMEKLATLPSEPVFDIVTSLGTIRIKLYSDTPKHRDNFAKLALTGFYDGILFHRVIDGFMIQGGDPLSKDPEKVNYYGTGGPGYNVEAEILSNHYHKKGALAAARRGDAANPMRESSGSQFYLVQDEIACAQLDGQYTVYGETIDGLNVIDKIAKVPVDGRDLPLEPVKIISVKLVEE